MNHDSRSFEDELSSVKADVAVIRSNYVTKADLQEVRIELKGEIQVLRLEIEKLRTEMQEMRAEFHKALHAQTWKMYGFGVVMVTAVHFVTRAGY
jgi:chaperonin cofactor prefoldin